METNLISNQLKSHFLRLYQIAFSDDNFDKLELQMMYDFARQRGITESQLKEILINPIADTTIPESIELKVEYLYDLAKMILADGIITEDEKNTLIKYCLRFEFEEENTEAIADFLLDAAKNNIPNSEIISQIK